MRYYCPRCEVLGIAETPAACWACGSTDVETQIEPTGPGHAAAMAAAIAMVARTRRSGPESEGTVARRQ